MITVTFDTLEMVNDLKQSGFTQEQSEAVVLVLKKAQNELATKQDIVAVKQDIENLRTDVKRDILDVKRDISELGKDLIIRLGVIIFVSFGLFSGLLAYIVKA